MTNEQLDFYMENIKFEANRLSDAYAPLKVKSIKIMGVTLYNLIGCIEDMSKLNQLDQSLMLEVGIAVVNDIRNLLPLVVSEVENKAGEDVELSITVSQLVNDLSSLVSVYDELCEVKLSKTQPEVNLKEKKLNLLLNDLQSTEASPGHYQRA